MDDEDETPTCWKCAGRGWFGGTDIYPKVYTCWICQGSGKAPPEKDDD